MVYFFFGVAFLIFFFFFNDTATTEIYTLSLHDALPISFLMTFDSEPSVIQDYTEDLGTLRDVILRSVPRDRKSTRLNSSHSQISYAVFCLKKKNLTLIPTSGT